MTSIEKVAVKILFGCSLSLEEVAILFEALEKDRGDPRN